MPSTFKLAFASLTFAVLCLASATDIKATTITFNPLEQPGTGRNAVGSSYTEAGFIFTSNLANNLALATAQQQSTEYAGSAGLFSNFSGQNFIRLSAVSGAGFSLNSISLSLLQNQTGSVPVTFTGTLVGGGTVSQTFTVTQFGFLPFTLNSSFTNLAFVDIGPQATSPFFQIDNVVVNGTTTTTPTPEPTTMLLLGTGLAGVGATVRKRRKASTQA
jgi:hypothetical protein